MPFTGKDRNILVPGKWLITTFPVIGAVEWRESKGSPQESYSNQTCAIKRVLETAWPDRWRFAIAMLGDAYRVAVPGITDETGQVYGIRRVLPNRYKNFSVPNFQFLIKSPIPVAVDSIEGIGNQFIQTDTEDGIEIAGYDIARLTIRYEMPVYPLFTDEDIDPTSITVTPDRGFANGYNDTSFGINEACLLRNVSRFTQPSAEALTMPNGAFKFVDGMTYTSGAVGSIVMGSNVRIVPTTEVHYTWHMVPGKPLAINSLIGTVNQYYFDGYAPGTLLLVAVEIKPYRWITGRKLCDITYKMKHFTAINPATNLPYSPVQRGHNYFLNHLAKDPMNPLVNKPDYQLITREGTVSTNTVYRQKDFNLLFNPNDKISPNLSDDALTHP